MLSNTANPFEAEYHRTVTPPRPPSTNSPSTSIGDVTVPVDRRLTSTPTSAPPQAGEDTLGTPTSLFSSRTLPLSGPPGRSDDATSPTATISQLHNRVELARFEISGVYRGKELVRAITYFTIMTEIIVENNASFTVPDIPITAPHLTGIDVGVRRNDWSRGNSACVDRRYSEVVDLRELLTFQFPTLIIPPLPRKNSVSDIETYFSAADAVATQRHNLKFFLSEIAAMPQIIFFSEWVARFFLDPRDTFETNTLVEMRLRLHELRLATRAFRECSKRQRSFTEYTANKIAVKSSNFVRSVADFLFSPRLTDARHEGADTDTYGYSGGSAAAPVPTSSSSSTYDWTYLPPAAKADACSWVRVCEKLLRRQKALKVAAKSFEKYLSAIAHTKEAEKRLAESFQSYELTLRSSPALATLGSQYHHAVTLIDAVAVEGGDEFVKHKYVNMCLRLGFEGSLINAVLDAVDVVLGQYQFLSSAQLTNTRDVTHEETLAYTQTVSRALHEDFLGRYKTNYEKRMRNLVREQVVRPLLKSGAAVQHITQGSELLRVVQDASFTDPKGIDAAATTTAAVADTTTTQ